TPGQPHGAYPADEPGDGGRRRGRRGSRRRASHARGGPRVMAAITTITGRGLPLRGNDLDTDRIMPARFLRAVTFEGLEKHLFEDDRASNPAHPFNDQRYKGATILVVNSNFGCGSSREHAPQGLARFGVKRILRESFYELFQWNSAI